MSWDTTDYKKMKEIESDLNSIKVELQKHNKLMQELIDHIQILTLSR